jgi:hypothetical protein
MVITNNRNGEAAVVTPSSTERNVKICGCGGAEFIAWNDWMRRKGE